MKVFHLRSFITYTSFDIFKYLIYSLLLSYRQRFCCCYSKRKGNFTLSKFPLQREAFCPGVKMPVFLAERLGLGPGSASSWLELPTKEDPVECCLEELGFLLTYGRHALCPHCQTQAGLPGPGHPKHLGAHTYSLSVSQPLRKILKRKESRCKRIFHNNNFLSKHYYMAIFSICSLNLCHSGTNRKHNNQPHADWTCQNTLNVTERTLPIMFRETKFAGQVL